MSENAKKTKKRGSSAPPQQQWDWNWSSGRPVPVAKRAGGKAQRPLFKKQPSDNYNLWIFNPDKKLGRAASKR